jgi:hypothetical protein
MSLYEISRNRYAQQIAICDNVLERLDELEDNGALTDLIADVRMLRVSLLQALVGLDGDGEGSQPST